jgi:peptidoglycan/xylan/chitin deacetylase (PgdA/CDA1 family)
MTMPNPPSYRRRSLCDPGALILLYHRVVMLNSDPQLLCVDPRHFEQQLDVLKRDYQPLSLIELAEAVSQNHIPDRAVVVTFDDGYLDNLEFAKPLLAKYEIPATVFVTARGSNNPREFWWDELEKLLLHAETLPPWLELTIDHQQHHWQLGEALSPARSQPEWNVLDEAAALPRQGLYLFLSSLLRPLDEFQRNALLDELSEWSGISRTARMTHRCMDDDQLRNLVHDGLIDVGAHTITHPVLAFRSLEEQRAEIVGSRRRLEEILNQEVMTFSYPYGTYRDYSDETVSMVRENGFLAACANVGRRPRPQCIVNANTNLHTLPRLIVADVAGDEFEQNLHACWQAVPDTKALCTTVLT